MVSNESPYILTEEDTSWDSGDECPEVRVARNPDCRVLRAVLARPRAPTRHPSGVGPNPADKFQSTNTTLVTPLIAAIKDQRPDNVRVLLQHGANPNGFSLSVLTDYASRFLQFRCGRNHATAISTSPVIPITEEEIKARSKSSASCFYGRSNGGHRLFYHGGDGLIALEEACKHDSTEIFEIILSASPEISFWTDKNPDVPKTSETSSSLSVSNPLICSVKYGQMSHVKRFLDLDFNPNSMPLACRPRCFSPLMATLLCCDPPDWEAFSLLATHPEIELDILTPISKVHILHIAASLMSLEVLQCVLQFGCSLSAAGSTALGHNLLHIACLPPRITHVNIFMESIYQSAREFRKHEYWEGYNHIIFDEQTPRPQPTDFFDTQMELVRYLISESANPDALIVAQDCHGNTALHYLAVYRIINHKLLDLLIEFS